MSPLVSWILVLSVVFAAGLIGLEILRLIDRLRDWAWERRYLRRRR